MRNCTLDQRSILLLASQYSLAVFIGSFFTVIPAFGQILGQLPTFPQTQSAPARSSASPDQPQTVTPTTSQSLPQSNDVTALSFQQAIQTALANNFRARLAQERINEATGKAQEARGGLLPEMVGVITQRSETVNLAAMGFQAGLFPGSLPLLIGPFDNFDARARLVQSIFNWRAIQQYRAGQSGLKLARVEEQMMRQQVVTQTALAYLNSISAERAVEAAQANLALAQSLFKLAQDRRDAGVATGIDVTRAQIRAAEEQLRLVQTQTNAQQARIAFLRVVGLPLANAVKLTEALPFLPEPLPGVEQLVTEAQRERPEIRAAEEQLQVSGYSLSAAKAERLPTVDFVGDYGESGNTPWRNAVPTRTAGVRVTIPLFGGRTQGRITQARSQQQQAALRLQDTRTQVEEDVRLALQNITTAAEQVRVAQQALALAQREVEMARDRFSAGVADNLEVVNAQTSLANAREREVAALAQYNAARINLAAARGQVEAFHW